MNTQTGFTRIGHILASAGAAVGIANLVMFPARMHNYGGLAFVLVFVICTFMLGIPLMIAEVTLGKNGQSNAVRNYEKIGGKSWGYVGILGIVTTSMVLSFYNIVAGWCLNYLYLYVFDFQTLNTEASGALFGKTITNEGNILIFAGLFMLVTVFIASTNIRKGIERVSKIFMPLLLTLLLLLIILVPFSNYGGLHYQNLIQVDFHKLIEVDNKGNIGLIEAVGQAFFSLSLGACAMMTYGSYISPKTEVVRSSDFIVHTDTVIALLSGILIVPLLPSSQSVGADPSLIFVYLINTFKSFGALHQLVGICFFVLLSLAIITSCISMLEPPTAFITQRLRFKRRNVVLGLGILIFLIGIPSAYSFDASNSTLLTNFMNYGSMNSERKTEMGFFNFFFDVFGTFSLIVGAFLLCVFIAKVWKFEHFFEEIELGGKLNVRTKNMLMLTIKWVIPIFLLLVFVAKVYGVLVQHGLV